MYLFTPLRGQLRHCRHCRRSSQRRNLRVPKGGEDPGSLFIEYQCPTIGERNWTVRDANLWFEKFRSSPTASWREREVLSKMRHREILRRTNNSCRPGLKCWRGSKVSRSCRNSCVFLQLPWSPVQLLVIRTSGAEVQVRSRI